MEMKSDSAPGPNGFSVTFFKNFWNMYKNELMEMFSDFYNGTLDIKRLNYEVITLVPKLREANNIRLYRPICLLNVDFKIFSKLLANRSNAITMEVIDGSQTAFTKDRNILEGVVILHEVLYELKRTKRMGLILKIDFEKAYDKVK
uniref:Reverse transcriptase domain-containing protein n=1 Tax=Arundo donax TaxID=35708 RepID=A0A0A9BDC7_ARUDO